MIDPTAIPARLRVRVRSRRAERIRRLAEPPRVSRCGRARRATAFTLIEMIVVLVIILILAGIVVPAASTLWSERKMSGTVNTLRGLLMTARVRALQSDGAETGFLIYLDGNDQRIVPIEQPADKLNDTAWQNVFRISDDRGETLLSPIRIVPLYAAEDKSTGPEYTRFSPEELANGDFDNPPGEQAQRHRNYFSIIYSTDGYIVPHRDVLIWDEDADEDEIGDRTGLKVGPGPPGVVAGKTDKYYARNPDGPGGETPLIDPVAGRTFPDLVIEPEDEQIALNFPSISGLLVYDDELFGGLPAPEDKRKFLLDNSQPLYVNRYTGEVILGPLGEAQ